jgi:nucleoside-diphosphate-sugar epimerase
LVTGANGFVGRALCDVLAASGHQVRRVVRAAPPGLPDTVAVGDINGATDWGVALEGVQCVVHLAARTHVLRETAADPLSEYRRVNVAGTLALAQQAARAGVRRLVFLSSVKVNGKATTKPFIEGDAPHPEDAYGVSKWEAEQALARAAAGTGVEVFVLRPPLVYGAGVKGNFLRLMGFVARARPLPLASIANRRSLVYVGNLVDAIINVIDTHRATGRTYFVSDGEDVSTPDLVRAIARALGVEARLLPCPPAVLKLGAALVGKHAEVARLTGSLQVDCSAIRHDLDWRPRYGLAQGLAETARWYYSRSGA